MPYEFKDVSKVNFPVVSVRSSVYKNIINEFKATQLERALVDLSNLTATAKQIRSALRRIARDTNIEITEVTEDKKLFIRKV